MQEVDSRDGVMHKTK